MPQSPRQSSRGVRTARRGRHCRTRCWWSDRRGWRGRRVSAVEGITCIKPTAPAPDSAFSTQLDSHLMTAHTKRGSIPWRAEDSRIASSCCTGKSTLRRTNPGAIEMPSDSRPTTATTSKGMVRNHRQKRYSGPMCHTPIASASPPRTLMCIPPRLHLG